VNYKTLEGDEFTALFSIHIPQKKSEQKTVPVSIQSIQDIKDAESEKEESLKKLNEAQKLSHVRSWEYFIETDTVIWSKELFNIFERSYELGAPNYSEHKSLYTKESFAIMDQAVINCVQNEVPYDIELDIYTSNGNIRHIVSKGKVKKDSNNKVIGCYGTAQDITQSKLVQNKLEQQTEKLYELNNALNQAQKLSHVGNWQWNMTTDKAEWSDEMYNIYGVTRDSFYPSNENVAKTVLPEDLTKVQRGIESLLIDKMFVPFEFRIMRPSGEVRDLYIIALEKNSQDSVFGVTKDITDQKKTEAKLINANKELEVFFYRTSHDLRAPLARIMGLLQIISPSQNLKEIKSYMELIEQSTFKLNNTLSDLIEIIQVRKGQLEKTEVDIEEVVDEIVETHNSKKEYEIELRKSFEHKTIYTDLIYLKIILRNLLSNALKFSTDFRDSYISVQTSKTDKKFEIKVEDNGIGIREEAKDHLFEMFYRGGNESSEGAGLGLFIVKDAVNKLGGKIYFESEKNKGSTFYVELPLD
jgi:signal transduction histidine kinase